MLTLHLCEGSDKISESPILASQLLLQVSESRLGFLSLSDHLLPHLLLEL